MRHHAEGTCLGWFLSTTAAACAQRMAPAPGKEAALERRWAFSAASEGQRLGAIALGVANLVGVLFLSNLLGDPAVLRALGQSSLGFMTGLFPFLQVACLRLHWLPASLPRTHAPSVASLRSQGSSPKR